MKSVEEIERRIADIKASPIDFENDLALSYLNIAKDCDKSWWLLHLLRKYKYEIEEDIAIVKILEWILEDEI